MSKPDAGRLKYAFMVTCLFIASCLLVGRLTYIYLGDPLRFPITVVKIVASYKHIKHNDLEAILSRYQEYSFFTLPASQLFDELQRFPWTGKVEITRQWPDTIKILLKEKKAVATWNGDILTDMGVSIPNQDHLETKQLPHLMGPSKNAQEVLKMHDQMQAILTSIHLKMDTLIHRDNHAWEAILANGVVLKLGKQDTLVRTARFCKAYAKLTERPEPLVSVDLRYPKGMAVKWDIATQARDDKTGKFR